MIFFSDFGTKLNNTYRIAKNISFLITTVTVRYFKVENIKIWQNTSSPGFQRDWLTKDNYVLVIRINTNRSLVSFYISQSLKYQFFLCKPFCYDEIISTVKELTTPNAKGVINNSSIGDLRTEWSNKVYTCL